MLHLIHRLWTDDAGALISTEFLFVATILIIGIIVGLVSVRNAVSAELAELANAILALSQEYTISGLTGCCASVEGSATSDSPSLVIPPTCDPNFTASPIDVQPCG